MSILYSHDKNACYDTNLNYKKYPEDVVEVDLNSYNNVWCGSAPEGQECGWDKNDQKFIWVDIPEATLDEVKSAKLGEINQEYETYLYAGFYSDATSYESSLENQSRIMMAKMAQGGMVESLGVMVTLTGTEADQVFTDMNTYINTGNTKLDTARKAINSATTSLEVLSVIF